jgi:hypothetical protein
VAACEICDNVGQQGTRHLYDSIEWPTFACYECHFIECGKYMAECGRMNVVEWNGMVEQSAYMVSTAGRSVPDQGDSRLDGRQGRLPNCWEICFTAVCKGGVRL